MGCIIIGKIDSLTQSSNNMVETYSNAYKSFLDIDNPPSLEESEIIIDSTRNSTQGFMDSFLNFALTFESAVVFMIIGSISIITGVFGVDFWKALINFFMPTP